MGKTTKSTIEDVRNYIKIHYKGFDLISDEYIGAQSKLKLKCPIGHMWNVTFANLKASKTKSCGICSRKNKKFTLEYVADIFNKEGCILLEEKYINANTKMKYLCVCGNTSEITLGHFNSGKRCRKCFSKNNSERQRLSYDFVKDFFRKNGFELISDSYNNAKESLVIKCENGHIFNMCYDAFKRGQRCKECHGKNRYDIEKVRKIFQDGNCTLLEDTYIDCKTPMKFECECGTVSKITLSVFQRGSRCVETCRGKKIGDHFRTDFNVILHKFSESNAKLLSKEKDYKSKDSTLMFICKCGEESTTTWSSCQRAVDFISCRKCSNKKISEKQMNRDITEEERLIQRKYYEYTIWRNSVYERDNYTCQCCGQRGGKLNAHHYNNYSEHKDIRTDLNNGITLCKECHQDFHNLYGFRNNNEAQLIEFIEDFHKTLNIIEDTDIYV